MAKNKDSIFDTAKLIAGAAGHAGSKAVDKAVVKAKSIDTSGLKEKASAVAEKAGEIKDSAIATKDDIQAKLTELDRMLSSSITEYNDAYTLMNDKGIKLFVERSRATDTVENVEGLINSIANRPKTFDADFEEININRGKFIESCEFANKELQAAREAAGGAGAGLAAGASVAFMAPTAAMWIATTFGTASTGTAISTLSGAAATNAALAWLGGGTLAQGAGGIAAGKALLAMAGPIGLTIAGATFLSSMMLFANKRTKLNKQKNEEIESVKKNIETVKELDGKINQILIETTSIREKLSKQYRECLALYGKDYASFDADQKMQLVALVNNTKALSAMFEKTIA